jgi:hypothetical protein
MTMTVKITTHRGELKLYTVPVHCTADECFLKAEDIEVLVFAANSALAEPVSRDSLGGLTRRNSKIFS